MLQDELLTSFFALVRRAGYVVEELEGSVGWQYWMKIDRGRSTVSHCFWWDEGEWRSGERDPGEDPLVMFATPSLETMLKWLIYWIDSDLRSSAGFPPIQLPGDEKMMVPGWRVHSFDSAWNTLVDPQGQLLPMRSQSSKRVMAAFSHLAQVSVEDVILSYEDFFGCPALSDFVTMPKGVSSHSCNFPLLQINALPWAGLGTVLEEILVWAEEVGLRVVRKYGESSYVEVVDEEANVGVCVSQLRGWWRLGVKRTPNWVSHGRGLESPFLIDMCAGSGEGELAVRWFIVRVGEIVREVLGFAPIMLPHEKLAPGKEYEELTRSVYRLLKQDGQPFDMTMRHGHVELSYVLDCDVRELIAAYRKRDGGILAPWVRHGGYLW